MESVAERDLLLCEQKEQIDLAGLRLAEIETELVLDLRQRFDTARASIVEGWIDG